LDGDGVTGIGAKTYCPCEAESHTLTVYFSDDSREDYKIDLTVTGQCDSKIATPESSITPTNTPQNAQDETRLTATPSLVRTSVNNLPPARTATRKVVIEATNTSIANTPTSTLTSDVSDANVIDTTPTPTKVFVQGQALQKTDSTPPYGIYIMALLFGFAFIGVGIWFWRSQL
ncbi:MAG: hypothetical protein P1S60_17745, partial [Anaerolineae bacterium]|nr:hypothetical protein [Anaerolineae bacterium]